MLQLKEERRILMLLFGMDIAKKIQSYIETPSELLRLQYTNMLFPRILSFEAHTRRWVKLYWITTFGVPEYYLIPPKTIKIRDKDKTIKTEYVKRNSARHIAAWCNYYYNTMFFDAGSFVYRYGTGYGEYKMSYQGYLGHKYMGAISGIPFDYIKGITGYRL